MQRELDDHNPWREDASDPDEGNIDHVEWHGNGVHFSRTSYRSSPPGNNGRQPPDIVTHILANMLGEPPLGPITGPPTGPPPLWGRADRRDRPTRPYSPEMGFGIHRHDPSRPNLNGPRLMPISPLQEGPFRQGNGAFNAPPRPRPRNTNGPQSQGHPIDDLHGWASLPSSLLFTSTNTTLRILSTMLSGFSGTVVMGGTGPNGSPSPFSLLTQLLNPANAHHGDAVYTQEALDRVISQLMEQHSTSSAPGPASSEAIAALPKAKVQESMLGNDGKAECSVCMDNVEVGEEVTMLPCKHWFHGDCVGAWLKEHDTCPHCRQSITPKDGDFDTPRTPGQAPRHSHNPWDIDASGSQRNPHRINESPTPGPSSPRPSGGRRASSQSGGSAGGGGFSGWVNRRLGGGGSGH